MDGLDRYRQALASLPEGIVCAEINIKQQDDTMLSVRNGKQEKGNSYTQTLVKVFACDGNHTGRVETECLADDPVYLLKQALENAQYTQDFRKIKEGQNICVCPPEKSETIDDMYSTAVALEDTALALPEIETVTHCSIRRRILQYQAINSMGADEQYKEIAYMATIGISIVSSNGEILDGSSSAYTDSLQSIDLQALAAQAVRNAYIQHSSLELKKIPAGNYNAVFASGIAANMMVISWMSIVGSYMRKNPALYPFNPVSIVNYSEMARETWGNQVKEDVETPPYVNGTLSVPANLTSNVKLVSTPSRLYISPSEKSLEALLNNLNSGIFITNAFDIIHSVEPSTGDFSILCDGLIYEMGQPVAQFERAVVSGNMQCFMRNISDTANDLVLSEFMNSSYAYGGPSVLVRDMHFSN